MDGNNPNKKGVHQGTVGEKSRPLSLRQQFIKEVKVKAASYCAYQERTQQQVRDKLYELGLHRDEVEEVISDLITENFVNEERYAKAFARGKFHHNKWGRLKILQELKIRGLSEYCMKAALKEIDDEDYLKQLKHLAEKKLESISGDDWVRKNKTARYLIGKGYEGELTWSAINELAS